MPRFKEPVVASTLCRALKIYELVPLTVPGLRSSLSGREVLIK